MIRVEPLTFDEGTAIAVQIALPKTNLLAVATATGYIMCGALDVSLLNTRLRNREIIAGRAVGVRTLEELLAAPLEQVTDAAAAVGWHPGIRGRTAIALLLAREKASGKTV
ncbi:YunC family protein [Kyrpidia tusciae]|uniref:DUF1805 domain-containing protein n=1 Tax=Kyrpidia tusciae (strain DSM 2912 / NBRC 15312 / T2) TaxID=562970 RepID=D5WTT5_KYRT2|nr:DUF1805 domain-containing protein [Kyrpidia tusciae]ADG05255.1 Domain of unknown function DUF1805 [Kyrpidia tusciae DSM 2912]MBE3552285.1 DUF1805 domain-containing protein [Kyrpidia tusciae]